MDATTVNAAKAKLLAMREEILGGLKETIEGGRDFGGDDVPDIGDFSTTTYNRDILFSLGETQRQMLRDIDRALDLIEEGEYGVCLSCGEDIAPKRMEVRPFSRYCIECKTEVERFGE